ncbi:hypothetical protein O3P69_017119 [Scylla paramamosain]|uniref:Uncharacterized protein n=1 Tax=Scylla paramamosain TaxID=85552 RepID=A0AAW0TU43_SCYPA
MERGNVTHARPFVRLPPPPAQQDAAAEPPPSIRVGSRDLKAWTTCVAAAGGVPSERGRIATTTQLEWWAKLPKAVTAKHAGQGRECCCLPPPPPLRSPPTRHRHGGRSGLVEEVGLAGPPPTSPPTVIVAVIGINQGAQLATTTATTEAPNAGDEWCLPPAARGAIGVSRRGGPAGPPPTSPPTVIVAVIGINQRAQLATTAATTEAPNAGDEWCLLPQHGGRSGVSRRGGPAGPPPTSPPTVIVAVIGINQGAQLATTTATTEAPNAVVSRGRDLGETGRDRNNNQRLGCCYYYPSKLPPLPIGCRRHKEPQQPCADDSPDLEACTVWAVWKQPTVPIVGAAPRGGDYYSEEEEPLLATDQAKQNDDDQTGNNGGGGGCARPNGRRRHKARPRGTHGRGSMDTPTLPTVGDLPRGGDNNNGCCARPNGRRRRKATARQEPQQPCADDSPTSGHARSRQYGHANTTHGRRSSPRRGTACSHETTSTAAAV